MMGAFRYGYLNPGTTNTHAQIQCISNVPKNTQGMSDRSPRNPKNPGLRARGLGSQTTMVYLGALRFSLSSKV